MPDRDAIAETYAAYSDLLAMAASQGQWSYVAMLQAHVGKLLLLSCASRFEKDIQEFLLEWANETTSRNVCVVSMIETRVIKRQYHTYFDWDRRNANKFFAMFGQRFKDAASRVVDNDAELTESVAAFLELGSMRNSLVHEDFVTFPLDKTAAEVYELYRRADKFIQWFKGELRMAVASESTSEQSAQQHQARTVGAPQSLEQTAEGGEAPTEVRGES